MEAVPLVATALMASELTWFVGTPMSRSTGKTLAGVELDGAFVTVSSAAWMEPPVKVTGTPPDPTTPPMRTGEPRVG